MNPLIASLHDRMAQGGEWRAFRDEIADLHRVASNELEHIALLEAHAKLIAMAPHVFDADTYQNVAPIAVAEYKAYLIAESTELGVLNPMLLNHVTAREVEAGRLDAEDGFRKLAQAGVVLGDSAMVTATRSGRGDWFFYGVLVAAVLALALRAVSVSPLWLIAIGLAVGWALNTQDRKKAVAKLADARSERFNATPA